MIADAPLAGYSNASENLLWNNTPQNKREQEGVAAGGDSPQWTLMLSSWAAHTGDVTFLVSLSCIQTGGNHSCQTLCSFFHIWMVNWFDGWMDGLMKVPCGYPSAPSWVTDVVSDGESLADGKKLIDDMPPCV